MSRVLGKRVEDPNLGRREARDRGALFHLVGLGIEAEGRELEPRLGLLADRAVGAPEDRAAAGGELPELVRLRYAVVRAELEPAAPVLAIVGAAHHEDRRLVLRAHRAYE